MTTLTRSASARRAAKALSFGLLGAATMSLGAALVRLAGVRLDLELVLGTMTGMQPSTAAFALGLAIHLGIGSLFGIGYAWLFEKVWAHGGGGTGVLIGLIHAAFLGVFVGLASGFHPLIPSRVADPGPYFANHGSLAVISFFLLHLVYGLIVGSGYGHVSAEREWAPLLWRKNRRASVGSESLKAS